MMTPTGRPATWAVIVRPGARAARTLAISRRQRSGSLIRSVSRNHTGRPVSFESRVIQPNSPASSTKSLFMPKAPRPASPSARPMPNSSASSAKCPGNQFAGIGLVRIGARGGEAERAGAHRLLGQAAHLGDVLGRRRLAVDAALAHDIDAQRMMRHLRRDIDRARHAVERVEVFRKALPFPVEALGERGAGDVLDRLHQIDQAGAVLAAAPARSRRRNCRTGSS